MRKTKKKTIIAVSFVIFLTILLHFSGWVSPIENFVRDIFNGGVGSVYKLSLNIDEQQNKNLVCPDLQTELNKLKIDRAKLILLEEENEQLREQLNFFIDKKFNYIGAQVIGKDFEPFSSSIILNKGKKDGIEIGNPVIASGGVLVGKIIKSEDTTSVVRLINDNQSKIAGTLTNKDTSMGLVEGGYGISVHMNLIPQNETIHIGDTVITSGLEARIPRGLLIGTVEAVEKEPYQPFQKAILQPLSDLDKLFLVSVITFVNEE
ncbi:MAG: rod shape-determining protein MreC [Candidatus Magasanikbacteria bacterium]|nr:rod shape-determining protein MreC [Candidatus Magasanikbacteria bacterium]